MSSVLKGLVICTFLLAAHAFAEDLSSATDPLPPGSFTSHQHSDEWLIKNALSAGPEWITDKATVKVMDMQSGRWKVSTHPAKPGS